MYVYKLRQKSTGKFFARIDSYGVPCFTDSLSGQYIFPDKEEVKEYLADIERYRKTLSHIFTIPKPHRWEHKLEEHAEKAKLLRPGNFELVVYFCTKHSVSKP